MAEEVKFFGTWASPFSFRVKQALKLKGMLSEYIEEDMLNKSPSLLHYNPIHTRVPLLVHNDKPVAESFAILEYLDGTWECNPIMPQDPYERDKARFYAKFIDEKVLPTMAKLGRSTAQRRKKSRSLKKFISSCKFLFNAKHEHIVV